MPFIRRHWYNVGAVIAAGALVYLLLGWSTMGVLRRLLLLNFIVLLLHQFEEYGWPGGFPAIMNRVLRPSPVPDRYPLNQNGAMAINVIAAYGFYLVPVFFPTVIWLGLAPVLFGMLQFIGHGIVMNVKLRSVYNPGLAAVTLGHVPIGVCYLYYLHTNGFVNGRDWFFGVTYMFAFIYFGLIKLNFTWLSDPNSPYPFAQEEMRRFDVSRKLSRLKDEMP
jgi:Protein of unknown function with HXXEE motif